MKPTMPHRHRVAGTGRTVIRSAAPSLIAIALTFSVACGGADEAPDIDYTAPVVVETIARGDIREFVPSTGTVRARDEVPIVAESSGNLVIAHHPATGRRLREGDRVTAGQVIGILDSPELTATARTSAKKAAWLQARQDFERNEQLERDGIITSVQLDEFRTRMMNARFDYEHSLSQEGKTQVTSPIAGIVGNFTRAADGQRVTAGFEVCTILSVDDIIVELNLPSGLLGRIAAGQRVVISSFALGEATLDGTIAHISPTVDRDRQTVRVEVGLTPGDHELRPGMFVRADIEVDARANVLVIPREVIQLRNNVPTVFVAAKQKAESRSVTLGLEDDARVEIRAGLDEGERLVVQGFETLTDGARIRIRQ